MNRKHELERLSILEKSQFGNGSFLYVFVKLCGKFVCIYICICVIDKNTLNRFFFLVFIFTSIFKFLPNHQYRTIQNILVFKSKLCWHLPYHMFLKCLAHLIMNKYNLSILNEFNYGKTSDKNL